MRVISQDGTIDIPYEQVTIERLNKEVYFFNMTLKAHTYNILASYSTAEKAEEAMEKLHRFYVTNKLYNLMEAPQIISGLLENEELISVIGGIFYFPSEEELK